MDIEKLKKAAGYDGKPQQWQYGFDLACRELAKASAVPDGFVLVEKSKISSFWQDDDEPENFCERESDLDCLGDCIDLGEIMTIKKHDQALISTETLYGTWFADAAYPHERANFFVGTYNECLEIINKNEAMIEAQEPAND